MTAGSIIASPTASAGPTQCNEPTCVPGIQPGIVLGSYCDNFTYYAFGVTSWGRLVFCGSPRRYEPRWFRSPEMRGIKDYMSDCAGYDGEVAQAPDGLFLSCVTREDGFPRWERGDLLGRRPALPGWLELDVDLGQPTQDERRLVVVARGRRSARASPRRR